MKKILALTLSILMLSLLTACNALSQPTLDIDIAGTQAAETVNAVLTAQALPTTISPTDTAVPTTPPTATSLPPTSAPTTAPTLPPTQTPTLASCTNQAEFISDVTIPDDTVLLPGDTFMKTWRLKNTGTCTWTMQYSLLFVTGDQMGAQSPTMLSEEAKPGEEIDLTIQFKSPATPGTYRSDWTLADPSGAKIGLVDKPEETFWVQIKVEEGTSALDLGSPDWKDTLDSSSAWYILDTENTDWEFEDGELRMRVKNTDQPEEWGLSSKPALTDFFLQVTVKTGDTCAGLDRYGVLVRAPDPSMGYVFEFSCDGRYRLYIWDGEAYTAIQEWKSSAFILSGANQTNVLGIWLQGDIIRMYANSKLLAEFEDDKFDEGSFGLVVGADQTPDFEVYVDEVAYWLLED